MSDVYKYSPLENYLRNCDESVVLTFDEIEEIINDTLPKSAFEYLEWWGNDDVTHTQSKAWSNANFKATNVILGQSVEFVKQ